MKFNKNGGFTLVELIVVIAILAILAGVAVPLYSGYIAKANEAADLQMLGALNTAFNAACVEEDVVVDDTMEGAQFVLGTDKKITKLDLPTAKNSIEDAVYAAFQTYYAGNINNAFKVYEQIAFVDGAFVGLTADEAFENVTVNGVTFKVSKQVIAQMQNSQFGEMGGAKLLGEVDFASTMAQVLLTNPQSSLHSVLTPAALGAMMGYDMSDETQAGQWGAKYEAMVYALAQEKNISAKEASQQILANSAVLSVAQNSQGMTTANVTGLLKDDNLIANLSTKMDDPTTAPEAMAEAALAYGMYTAYMHKNDPTYTSTGITDLSSLQNVIKDDAFQAYVQSDAGQADLDAYIAALGVVNESAKGDVATGILTNGYGGQDLVDMMTGLLGK